MFNSKFVLVTSDSLNMISEALVSGKPVFGFDYLNQEEENWVLLKI